MNLLHTLGLMTRKEHEAIVADNDDRAYNSWIKMINERDFYVDEYKVLEAKFKKAVTDLEKQANDLRLADETITLRNAHIDRLKTELDSANDRAARLAPDALLWRNARDKRAGKRGAS